jgi:hypothetical protein
MSALPRFLRASKNPKRNVRRRETAVKFALIKIARIDGLLQAARANTVERPGVARKLFDRILSDIEELCELEENFPDLLEPHPRELIAQIEYTKSITAQRT